MLQIKNVSKTYGGGVKAVDDISLDIGGGQIVGFIGPNGAGKTTTIKMITGILNPDAGTVAVDGHDITREPLEAKKSFGFVPDSPDIFLRLKGMEYLNFMGDVYGVDAAARRERIASLAESFEMTGALNARLQTYSHGMRQKIVIMGVLLHNPKVWILDEPLTGLDPLSSHKLKELMREHAGAGNAVFFSTHVLEVAEKLCDEVVIINRGRILFHGGLDALQAQHAGMSLEAIFLEVTANG